MQVGDEHAAEAQRLAQVRGARRRGLRQGARGVRGRGSEAARAFTGWLLRELVRKRSGVARCEA